MKIYNSRKDVPDKYKWDLKDFFADDEDFNKNLNKAKELVNRLKDYNGCTKDPCILYKFINDLEEASKLIENLYAYAYLVNDQELGVSKSIENKNKIEVLISDFEANTAFFDPELLKLNNKEYQGLFENKALLEYKCLLDKIYRNKEHVLSSNEEEIIGRIYSSMDHFDDISSNMLNSCHNYGKVIIDGEEVSLTPTNYHKIMKNDNCEFRKETYYQFNKVLNQYGTISASLLDSFVKGRSVDAKIHNYRSSWDSKLFSNNMPKEVYSSLVRNVLGNVNSYQRYLNIFKDVNGLDTLHPYDLSLGLVSDKIEYSVEEAQELVFNAVSVLGEDYKKKFKKIYDEHYVDYACYKGKCSGGYSLATGSRNSRILMSFNGDLDSVSTLAHEGGHNVHHQFVIDNNPFCYREVSSLVSEVASLTNECLLSSYLVKNGKSREEKLSGINNIINVINSNLFGAVREGTMEQEFYELVDNGGTITKDYMDNLTCDSYKKFYGRTVELDDLAKVSWTRRSHYYMFFYLYAYSICISVAAFVSKEILNGNKDMLDKYIKFLSAGSDKWPMDAFSILGIDLTKDDVYLGAIEYYNSLLDDFERIRKEAV